jgi:hypothetical protein
MTTARTRIASTEGSSQRGARFTHAAYAAGRRARGSVHMIEEYARRNGHADVLRESIDGSAGDCGCPASRGQGRAGTCSGQSPRDSYRGRGPR